MGKRLIRISSNRLLGSKLDYVGKQGNVVLKTGATYFGYFISFENNTILFKDVSGHKHDFLNTDISELIIDQIAKY